MLVLGLVDIPSWLLLIVGIILLVLWYSSIKFSHFKKLGIPGPKPLPIFGNMLDFVFSNMMEIDLKYKKEYGPVVGLYAGFSPSMLIFDQEMLSQVMVKQFDHFVNRKMLTSNDDIISEMLTNLKDDHWKHVRSMMSPTFTTGKLRQMAGEINRSAIQLAENVASSEGPFELRESFGNYTMDVIASTAFGLRVDSQNSQSNPFVVNAKKAMNFSFKSPFFLMTLMFPKFAGVFQKMFGWSIFDKTATAFFCDIAKQTLDARNEGDENRSDFIQLMSNAIRGAKIYSKDDEDEVEKLSANITRTDLTEKEVMANAFIFFLAGYETTQAGLTMLIHCLAHNPECQQKLIEEIDSIIGDKDNVSYDDVMQMHYLDQCMQESLRLFPPASKVNRVTKKDIDINGVPFKKGTVVNIPIYALHHDPEIWTDPERFDPERFSPDEKAKRNPILWLPFGFGPRNCIGMRLATYELKVAVVHILRKQTIATCEKTEDPIQWERGKWLKPKNGIWLAAEKRK